MDFLNIKYTKSNSSFSSVPLGMFYNLKKHFSGSFHVIFLFFDMQFAWYLQFSYNCSFPHWWRVIPLFLQFFFSLETGWDLARQEATGAFMLW